MLPARVGDISALAIVTEDFNNLKLCVKPTEVAKILHRPSFRIIA